MIKEPELNPKLQKSFKKALDTWRNLSCVKIEENFDLFKYDKKAIYCENADDVSIFQGVMFGKNDGYGRYISYQQCEI